MTKEAKIIYSLLALWLVLGLTSAYYDYEYMSENDCTFKTSHSVSPMVTTTGKVGIGLVSQQSNECIPNQRIGG